jgi:TRAP-type transport system small permease protein
MQHVLKRSFLRWANHIGGALFFALFIVFIVQVVARFIFDKPLPWSDEAAVILYVWIILWACAFMVATKEHVVFDLLWNSANPTLRKVMLLLGHGMFAVLAFMAVLPCWDYIEFMSREQTAVMGLSFQWVFFPFVLLLVSLGMKSLWTLIQLMRGHANVQGDNE